MKTFYFLTFGLLFVTSAPLFSQTKYISHRSHSGSNETFTLQAKGNFGWDPSWNVPIDTTSQTDSAQSEPSATTVIDTATIEKSRVDSLQPKTSNGNGDRIKPVDADQQVSSVDTKGKWSGLLWLAFGLGVPATGLTLFRLRRIG